jgi:hypothetical protein
MSIGKSPPAPLCQRGLNSSLRKREVGRDFTNPSRYYLKNVHKMEILAIGKMV